ncbi:hypothetical protein [Bacillus sp. FJAT-45350]|uniref:hypothetical protein n=1 Tax=Bacillus sp. FJAT-45350 TaxID=2011014 RepID=UPI000BB8AB37|nr:hypothetical protein [Bacillus sp. FJAT-45350]
MVFVAILLAMISIAYNIKNDFKANSEIEKLKKKANRLEIQVMFDRVLRKTEEFDDRYERFLGLYSVYQLEGDEEDSEEGDNKEELQTELTRSIGKYHNLYREIEDFTRVIIESGIHNEDEMIQQITPSLKKLAINQAVLFGTLNEQAERIGVDRMSRPDRREFYHFNRFLEFNTEDDWFTRLLKVRNDHSFDI